LAGHSVAGGVVVTAKLIASEVRLVGAGFVIVTGNEPTTAISAAVIAAVKVLELTNVVVRLLPFHFTTAPLTKPEPVTVSVNAGSPTPAVNGVRLMMAGMTVKVTALEIKLPEVMTVIGKTPTVVISVATIDALNCVELMKVVERLVPLKRTLEPAGKPTPLTVIVNPVPPALTVAGETLVIDGLTTKLTAWEVPPPGAGFKTVIA